MTFFKRTDGSTVEPQSSASVGGFQSLIPDGTQLHCSIAGVQWEDANRKDNKHIIITLHVTEPGAYRNFTVAHKLHVFDKLDKKRDKAIEMLATYDTLCRGALLKADKEGKAIVDNNTLLARSLNGGNVLATFGVWEMEVDDKDENGMVIGKRTMTGNWVRELKAAKPVAEEKAEAVELDKKAESQGLDEPVDDYDDDIVF